MPIYEYRCSSCGQELEKLQRMSEAPLSDCPACHRSALRRLISPAGFRLKGSGWYETDFKKDNKRNVVETASEGDGKDSKEGDAGRPAESNSADSGKQEGKAATKSGESAGSKSDGNKATTAG